jgi:FixJ family two-component response regulator
MDTTRIAAARTATTTSFVYSHQAPDDGADELSCLDVVQSVIAQLKAGALVCIVDSDDSIRKAIARLLQSAGYVTESFASAQSFLSRKIHGGACCVIADVDLRGPGGSDLLQILAGERRTEQIVFTSGRSDVRACAQALKAGAVDFLAKPLKNSELLRAVENALLRSGKVLHAQKQKQAAQSLLKALTPREREVLSFVIAGKINKEIAAELGAGEKTIKKHRGHLMRKLNVGSVAELVHFSFHSGLKPARPYGANSLFASAL